MSRAERLAAYHRGELTFSQVRTWQENAPAELPATSITATGELPWILAHSEDYLGADF